MKEHNDQYKWCHFQERTFHQVCLGIRKCHKTSYGGYYRRSLPLQEHDNEQDVALAEHSQNISQSHILCSGRSMFP